MALDRRRAARALLALAVGFGGTYAAIAAVDAVDRDDAPRVLGTIDFTSYCADRGADLAATLRFPDPFGWHCVGLIGGVYATEPIDIADACATQFRVDATPVLTDESDVQGWRCTLD